MNECMLNKYQIVALDTIYARKSFLACEKKVTKDYRRRTACTEYNVIACCEKKSICRKWLEAVLSTASAHTTDSFTAIFCPPHQTQTITTTKQTTS